MFSSSATAMGRHSPTSISRTSRDGDRRRICSRAMRRDVSPSTSPSSRACSAGTGTKQVKDKARPGETSKPDRAPISTPSEGKGQHLAAHSIGGRPNCQSAVIRRTNSQPPLQKRYSTTNSGRVSGREERLDHVAVVWPWWSSRWAAVGGFGPRPVQRLRVNGRFAKDGGPWAFSRSARARRNCAGGHEQQETPPIGGLPEGDVPQRQDRPQIVIG